MSREIGTFFFIIINLYSPTFFSVDTKYFQKHKIIIFLPKALFSDKIAPKLDSNN